MYAWPGLTTDLVSQATSLNLLSIIFRGVRTSLLLFLNDVALWWGMTQNEFPQLLPSLPRTGYVANRMKLPLYRKILQTGRNKGSKSIAISVNV